MKLKNKTIYQLEKKLRQLEHDGIKTYRIGHIKNRLRIMKQKYSDKDENMITRIVILKGDWKLEPDS